MGELLNLDTISIKDIDLARIIISKCGAHNKDSLYKTIQKKLDDISKCGYCLWAHGHLNPEHTRKFCEESNQKDIFVIMPTTFSNSTEEKESCEFKSWFDGKNEHIMSTQMNKVTGPSGSNRAFCLKNLYKLEEHGKFDDVLQYYNAINSSNGGEIKDAVETLKGQCSNKCLEIKNKKYIQNVQSAFENNNCENILLVGQLCEPYHVELRL